MFALGLPATALAQADHVTEAGAVAQVAPPPGVVSPVPASNTPRLIASQDSPVEQIRQLVQCGNTMYAVGNFTEIAKGSVTYQRENVFSFLATAPYTVTSWAPDVVGTGTSNGSSNTVSSIAFSGGNCADAYIGGKFSSVNGTAAKNIAEIDTTTGNVVTSFAHSASGSVNTLLGVGGHILAGGYFTSVNGSNADPYLASLNPVTGKDDGFVHLAISGNYQFPGVVSNATRVFNQVLSHSGTLDLVMGDFTSVGGQPRQQIFMLDVSGTQATVTPWTSAEFNGNCATVEPFYVQAAAWSPDDSSVYISTTGYHPNGQPVGQTPRTGLCDVAAAFPSTQTSVTHTWINYTGCDSMFAAAADAGAAYFGGHERWSDNPNDCDAQGPGAYSAPGMEGLQPSNGELYVNAANTAGYYSRSRGYGADDMLVTSAGLWIASDNEDKAQNCGGVAGHSGICLLPYN
jgi:hypothetical protein